MFSVKIPFSITSLNVRGLQNLVKRKAMFLFCKNWDSHFIFLQETHSSECEKIVFSHGTTRSAGVAILFNKSPGKIITTRVDLNGHWVALVLNIEEVFFILINIYGYNSMSHNQRLFSELLDVIVELRTLYPTDNIILGGDFNIVPEEVIDRYPSKCRPTTQPNALISQLCLK